MWHRPLLHVSYLPIQVLKHTGFKNIFRVAIVAKQRAPTAEPANSHSQMEQYFFSYLLTWEVDLIEILEIMAQMWQYVIFLSLQPTKVTSGFIFY